MTLKWVKKISVQNGGTTETDVDTISKSKTQKESNKTTKSKSSAKGKLQNIIGKNNNVTVAVIHSQRSGKNSTKVVDKPVKVIPIIQTRGMKAKEQLHGKLYTTAMWKIIPNVVSNRRG